MEKIYLTQTVQKGGCAAKVAAQELREILAGVRFPKKHPELLVDGSLFDDAAIYKIDEQKSLVQTLDFFTPIVDTPLLFGKVAAANALSDVYAMGGRPVTCMAILAFPLASFSRDIIADVMQGASDVISEARATLVGGHSIDDDTLKFGLSVTGFVNTQRIWSNASAQESDVLILTKPLGTGTCTASLKRREKTEDEIMPVVQSMCQLNNVMDYLDEKDLPGIHAATDITGFGLSGHSMQMASASQKTFVIDSQELPYFSIVPECLEKGFLTKAHRTNAVYTQNKVDSSTLKDFKATLIHDPQTSGGLLLSVEKSKASQILQKLKSQFPSAKIIGQVEAAKEHAVVFR